VVSTSGPVAVDPDGDPQSIRRDPDKQQERRKDMGTILIIILVLVVIGALPTWPHSRSWGYYPSGGLGLILLILIILLLLGVI
jgi:Protein of unknown function (DUF3309)